VAAVEAEKGEKWETFARHREDAECDKALWLARELGSLSLQQLADQVGRISFPGISTVLRQMVRRLVREKGLATPVEQIENSVYIITRSDP
jgi:hypothetical protein